MKTRRIPLRKCTGCGEMKPKKELVRVVKSPEGDISLDLTGKKTGSRARMCAPLLPACSRPAKARRLEKGFACRIPDEVYDRMERS